MSDELNNSTSPATKTNKKKENTALAAYERLRTRIVTLNTQRESLEKKLLNQKRVVKQAQLVESYRAEETRTKNDEYHSLTDELKHRDRANKEYHSQIARLERQVADLHYEMGVGQRVGTSRSTSMVDLLPEAVSLGLDQALRDVDAKEQTTFTQLESSEARLQVIKGNHKAIDRHRVTILVKNVDPVARSRSTNVLHRKFIATEGLTFQDVLEDSLRFWNMMPEEGEEEERIKYKNQMENQMETKENENILDFDIDSDDSDTDLDANRKLKNYPEPIEKPRFCLADEGGALRFGHMLVSKDISASDVTKDDLVLGYLLFSLPKLDLAKVQEFSQDLDSGGFENNDSEIESGVDQDSDDDTKLNDDEENQHVDLFRYDPVLSDTPLLVKDLVFYIIWLFLWIMISVVTRDVSYNNQVSILSKHWLANRNWNGGGDTTTQDKWVNFESITTADEWWAWAQGPMTLTMSKSPGTSQAMDFGSSSRLDLTGGNAGGTFILYGGWRLRQARVPPNCLDSLSTSIIGKSIQNDPNKKLDNYYGTYGRLFCYAQTPFGPLNNGTDSTNVYVKHLSESIDGNNNDTATYVTTTTKHVIKRMTETPDLSTIALKYMSFNPFSTIITPPIADIDTIAWLKAFLYYPAPTSLQSIDNRAMGPYFDYRNPDFFDTGPKDGLISNYGGSGFVLELPANLSSASFAYRLHKLKENNWIDKQTRAVLARANFFNINSGQWVVVDALAEWDQSGKMKTMFKATPLLTDQYYTTRGRLGGLLSLLVFIGALTFVYQQFQYWQVVRKRLHKARDNIEEQLLHSRYMKRACCPVTTAWLSSMWTLIEIGVLLPCLIARVIDLILFFVPQRHFQVCFFYSELD